MVTPEVWRGDSFPFQGGGMKPVTPIGPGRLAAPHVESIALDGRQFTSQPDRADQRQYVVDHLRLADAIEIMSDLDGKTLTEEQRAEDLLTQVMLSGRTHSILAGCLTEEGKVWSRVEADRNAGRFAAITDADEKNAMSKLMVQFAIALISTAGKAPPESDAFRRFDELDVREQKFVN